mgnify:CR=1 FL=1
MRREDGVAAMSGGRRWGKWKATTMGKAVTKRIGGDLRTREAPGGAREQAVMGERRWGKRK